MLVRSTAVHNVRRSRFALLALTTATAVALLSAVGAHANPSIKDKRAQAQAIIAQIEELDHEVGAAAERWNGANWELGKLTTELTETRRDLGNAKRQNSLAQRRVASRLRQLYIGGSSASSLEVVLGARSLDEVLDRIDVAERVAKQDATLARDARLLRARIARQERRLSAARARQAAVVEQRAAEKRAIEGRLSERQTLLASVKDEIAELEEAERRRQVELERRARLALERQRQAAQQAVAQAAEAAATQATSAPEPAPSAPAEDAGGGASAPFQEADYQPPPADASRGAQVVAIAMQYLGIPYRWGAASPSDGFDCSGLTMYVFAKVGVSLPHYAAAQYQLGSPVSKDQLRPGDLVFFRGLGHMGMYIGGGNMIHAPRTGDVVKISSIYDSYYVANWVGARRVL